MTCPHCNSHTGAAAAGPDPVGGTVVRLFHPRGDVWQDHFRWSGGQPGEDVFPPSRRDPQGAHKLIRDRVQDAPFEPPADKPLTVASYAAGVPIPAYVEPVAVGDAVPDLPIFLTPDRYVPCPLNATYEESWAVFPKALKAPLDAPPA